MVNKFKKCQLNKLQLNPESTETIPTKIEGSFTHQGLYIIGPLEKTKNNNQNIIVAVDCFTKWIEVESTEILPLKMSYKIFNQCFSLDCTASDYY